jgi:hypothetical protein
MDKRHRLSRLWSADSAAHGGIDIDLSTAMILRENRRQAAAALLVCAAALLHAGPVRAQPRDVAPIERARGAEQVVVGHVSSVTPVWRNNDFGDRLIVSIVRVAVDETLKGSAQSVVDVAVEGGTIGSLTLHVSDLDSFTPGERAVFYLTHERRGGFVPHRRGLGLQKIDAAGRVRSGSATLEQIRRDVRAAAGRQP